MAEQANQIGDFVVVAVLGMALTRSPRPMERLS